MKTLKAFAAHTWPLSAALVLGACGGGNDTTTAIEQAEARRTDRTTTPAPALAPSTSPSPSPSVARTTAPSPAAAPVAAAAPAPAPAPTPAPAPAPAQAPAPAPAAAPAPATSTSAWRPFSASSPWNTPIPAGTALEANSAALIDAFTRSSPYGAHLDVNIKEWSVPVFYAASNTPTQPLYATLGGEGWMGWNTVMNVPIPAGAKPDTSGDGHLAIISADRRTEWGCYAASYNATRAQAWKGELCSTTDLTGTGVKTPEVQAQPWYMAHGPRACGFPLVAGLIRPDEIKAGAIEHALVVAYPGILKFKYQSPASTSSGVGVDSNGIPCGGRIQFDPSVDVTKLGLSPAAVIVMKALQKYGAYVGDYSGALSLYADNSADAKAYWNSGVLDMYALMDKIDLSKFRVVKYGTVYTKQ